MWSEAEGMAFPAINGPMPVGRLVISLEITELVLSSGYGRVMFADKLQMPVLVGGPGKLDSELSRNLKVYSTSS